MSEATSRWRPRTPGLRSRVAFAMIAAVALACAALTLTTTAWAATQHSARQEQVLLEAVAYDVSLLIDGMNPSPDAIPDELADIPPGGGLTWSFDPSLDPASEADPDSPTWNLKLEDGWGEGIFIPLKADGAEIDPDSAIQWGFINIAEPFSERHPECLIPERWESVPGLHFEPGSSMHWAEACGDYLMGYGFVATPPLDGVESHPWLAVRALYLPDQPNPVPALRNTLLLISGGIVAVAALLALAVAQSVIRPVARAGAMASAVADGDLSVRIPVRGNDDVAAMSRAVNTMADTLTAQIDDLERANESQRRFVADVAHELRTPTTALLASAEALRDPRTRDDAAALVAPQLGRLATLTEDLLEINRMDARKTSVVTSRIDLVDLITEVTAGTDIVCIGPPELWVETDPIRVQVILRNLLANAAQHGAPPVTVSLTARDSNVVIDVHDDGPGVPENLRDRVFDRFVRGDDARHGTSSGLGLAIARENARLLAGSLTLEADGATFRLSLPSETTTEEQ